MIYRLLIIITLYIKNELFTFEQDIRELVMAFFPYNDVKTLASDIILKSKIEKKENGDIDVYYLYENDLKLDSDYDRKEKKNHIKRSLYQFLSKETGKNLPWGALTGIRPVNIVTEILEKKVFEKFYDKKYDENNSDLTISEYLKNEYLVSKEKTDLLIEIAKNELTILERKENKYYKNRYSIYIGVPFCKSTCLYCSFTSFDIEKHKKMVTKYLDALEYEFRKEIANAEKNNIRLSNNNKFLPLTLYIGGGTPSSLDEESFARFLSIVDKYVETTEIEFTLEAGRPDTITREKLEIMKKNKVNRISINPQTFNQVTLDLIGRKHTVEDTINKFYMARDLGFDNINMDIIIGLPNENLDMVNYTLKKIKELSPDSLTIHSLALKRAARLNQEKTDWANNDILIGLKEENNYKNSEIYEMHKASEKACRDLGLIPYYLYRQKNIAGNLENIGFSYEGKESVYNIIMMSERHSVFGFGCGGVTKIVHYDENNNHIVKRIDGYKGLYDYVDRIFL